MYTIIPLAGPDFINKDLGIKPLFKIGSTTLIDKIIKSRSWIKNNEIPTKNIIFTLKDIKESNECEKYLKQKYLDCKIVKISSYAKGALMSSLAASSLIKDFSSPIIVDLIDIAFDFEEELTIDKIFKDDNIGAILPYFKSNNLSYSYADIKNNYVLETKEKKGWIFNKDNCKKEGNASAGVYFFKNLSIFLNSVSDSLQNFKEYNNNDNLFLCPAMNGVIKQDKKVLALKVNNIDSIGLKFK